MPFRFPFRRSQSICLIVRFAVGGSVAITVIKGDHLKMIVMAAVIVLLGLAAFQRNGVWVTKLSLWTDVARKTPAKSRVHNSLGNCYMLLGDSFHAVEEYKYSHRAR